MFEMGSRRLSALATDTTGKLDVLGHDGDTFGVDGAQVGVLEQAHQTMPIDDTFVQEIRSRPTLKERLAEHYKNRNFTAKPQTLNYFASSYVWYMTIICLCLFLYVAGDIHKDDPHKQYISSVCIVVIAVENILNWILAARKSAISYNLSQQVEQNGVCKDERRDMDKYTEEWTHCIACQQKAPPRSHHCSLCNMCILKCDHHCFFTACCIGFSNQKYFVVWLFWVTVSQIWMLYSLGVYLSTSYGFSALFFPPLPLYQWCIDEITSFDLLLYVHVYLCAMTFAGSLMYLHWQLLIIKRGQTTTEFFKYVKKYNQGCWSNFRSVFGPYWLVRFVVPLPFKQEGNGIDWEIKQL